MLVLKKCPECGLYNDISVMQCACGTNLVITPAEAVPEPPAELRGQIDPGVPAYVQKCPFCQTENFTPAVDRPFRKCVSCGRYQIGRVTPTLWSEEPAEAPAPKAEEPTPKPIIQEAPASEPVTPITTNWATALADIAALTQGASGSSSAPAPEVKPEVKAASGNLRLTAVGSFTGFSELFRKEDAPVLLGRYAGDLLGRGDPRAEQYARIEQFLGRDTGVSSYHCHLIYKDNKWFVQDGSFEANGIKKKPSTNGTRVNERPVSQRELQPGDVIKLGVRPDSITLSVEFES